MEPFTFGRSGNCSKQVATAFLFHTSAIDCGSADMPLQQDTSLKSCRLLKKKLLFVYAVVERHFF
jgi:hypothetical protein